MCDSVLQYVAVFCSMLQYAECVAMYCSVLQRVVACCSVFQRVAACHELHIVKGSVDSASLDVFGVL